ncbi:hypothetical protein AKJ09_08943 [Labilithrix luteola]|uniref:Long-chain fatty acid transport protein n=1 Tax=Labilithrix luteola TaxID=1391654 RepID=A0A0K1QA53_9BACT|nr:DUF3570 domain-containing protein [Labilithrix luteola]AKV02280.1 hypothetical protein AKJ09_08943 [Labilithrix luteola]
MGALIVAAFAFSSDAHADGNVTARASTEVAGYKDSFATSVLTPSIGAIVENPTAGWGVSGRYLVDVVSAASPDIVSTASPRWTEVRHAGTVGGRYKPGNFGVAASGGVSYTPDYLSIVGGGQLIQDLDEKNLTLVAGYSYGHDTIGRTGTPFSVFSHDLTYHTITAGISRVVNKGLVIGVYGDAIIERGDQSKPYRYVPMFAPGVAQAIPRGASVDTVASFRIQARPLEQLPLERDRWAVTGRLAWRAQRTTLRVEERLYTDSWSLSATTTDARYFIDLAERVTIWPHARLHVQSGTNFWQRAYEAPSAANLPAFRTGDRELGPLTNVGLGGGLRLALGKPGAVNDWLLSTTFDGTWTSFADAIYATQRFSGLVAVALEVTF